MLLYQPLQEIRPSDFEKHGGVGTAKKWKYTVRIDDDSMHDKRLGIWLLKHGLIKMRKEGCALNPDLLRPGRSRSWPLAISASSYVARDCPKTCRYHSLTPTYHKLVVGQCWLSPECPLPPVLAQELRSLL